MSTILQKIIDHKKDEVANSKRDISFNTIRRMADEATASRNFTDALRQKIATRQPAVIAEIKKASPSKGIMREEFDPVAIATDYENHGATCLSILTDEHFFQGHLDFLEAVRGEVHIPLLRKDFMIDPYQIFEAKARGADAILLIVAALDVGLMAELEHIALELDLSVLVESHDAYELEKALRLQTPLIGINNRNLHTFETSLDITLQLKKEIPEDRLLITESGINSYDDVQKMTSNDVYGFLIGEAFMREESPGKKLQEIFTMNSE